MYFLEMFGSFLIYVFINFMFITSRATGTGMLVNRAI